MTTLVAAVVNGLLLGLVYAAISAGLSLTLGVMGLINVAHSALAMLGAYLAWSTMHAWGVDPLVALVGVTIVFFFLGMAVERAMVKRVYDEPPEASLLSLFGLMIVLESALVLIWTTTERALPVQYSAAVEVGFLRVGTTRLVGGVAALVAIIAAHYFLRRSRAGRGIRAMASNRDAARIMGIDTERLSMLLFGIGTALAGTGGVAMAMIFPFTPGDHLNWLTLAILVVIVGGLGTLPRTVVAALTIGVVESLAGAYLPFEYVAIVLYSLLIVVLWVRREGLAGATARAI
ncbi:MAG: branched-chain amino acid ABC transporter permease [Actinomycetota bacterium]